MRRRIALLVGISMLLAVTASPVRGAAATPVTIDAQSSFDGPATFTATGIPDCSAGTQSQDARVVGRGSALVFDVNTTFTCAGGSLDVHVHASVRPCDPQDRGSWVITGGTGTLADLHGAGTLVGTYFPGDSCNADGIDDHYTGFVVIP
jgi:hypothetical protein